MYAKLIYSTFLAYKSSLLMAVRKQIIFKMWCVTNCLGLTSFTKGLK